MPEGDTLQRIALGLRPFLAGRPLLGASARRPGPQVERLVGRTILDVLAVGKNLLIRFEGGLELRTHLGMQGSWHRYVPGEPWRRPPGRARLVLEVDRAVAVCFDAPTVELLETRTEALHPSLGSLGPSLLDPAFDADEAVRRLREPGRAGMSVAEALLDQRAVAGIGNVYKNETLFLEGIDPFAPVSEVDDAAMRRLVITARGLMLANVDHASRRTRPAAASRAPSRSGRHWVYGRAGRPCRRCGTLLRSTAHGRLVRRTVWCPRCQAPGTSRRAEPAAARKARDD